MADFDRFAGDYESILKANVELSGEGPEFFADAKAQHAARLVGEDFAGQVLDFGCGVGLLARFLRERLPAARIDGFDVSPDSIASVTAELKAQGRFATRLDQLADAYDLVVISNVLHHIPPEQRFSTFQEMAGVLKPGGRLLAVEHNPINPATRWVVSRCAFDDDAVLVPAREMRRRCEDAGLVVDRRDYIVFFPRPLARLRPLEPKLGWLPLGAQYAVLARRPE